jgi:two-component system, OmpR family, phosphate regulon sensor histidine kinase PhoR
MMAKRRVRHYLWLLVAVLLSIMLVITAESLAGIYSEDIHVTELTTVVGPAYDLNSGILQTMTNAETGLRGYLDSGDPALLEPYNPAEQQARAAQHRLRTLLASPRISPADQRDLARLQTAQDTAIAAWWRYATDARATAKHGQTPSVIRGKAVFDQVRHANAALATELTARYQALRALSARTLTRFLLILLVTSVLAVLVGFAAASRISRAVAAPVTRLRRVVQRQRAADVRADEDDGPAEVRDLAAAFNALNAHNAEMAAAQAGAIRLNRAVSDIGRAIRTSRSVQDAMNITCATLGSALAARRVMVTIVDETPAITAAAQWHAPDLDDLAGVAELDPYLSQTATQIASELWSSGERVVINDLLAEKVQWHKWAAPFHRYSGATALILVPVGLDQRALGIIYVVSDTGRRDWAEAEVVTAQQTATFLARAITQVEYEAQRAEYITRLENLDRQKTEFLSTVSHELRTPLTSIQGYLELLLEGDVGPLAADQEHMLGVIERNTARLRGLIEDLLVLNRIESAGLIPGNSDVSVSELARDTVEELLPVAGKSAVGLYLDTDEDPATITGDRAQLHRALVYIVSNAIKFTLSEGTVRVSCRVDPVAGEVVVTCQDTGIGIPQADLEHLFTRFFRASNAASQAIPGTGLGLAIVQAIVELHHGRLALSSAEGEGTTIALRFPLAQSGASTAPVPDPRLPSARTG